MRKKHREKIIDITTSILEVLARFGGAASDAFSDQKAFYNEINSRGFDRSEISDRVRRFINSGHIEVVEEDGKRSIRFPTIPTIRGSCRNMSLNRSTKSRAAMPS